MKNFLLTRLLFSLFLTFFVQAAKAQTCLSNGIIFDSQEQVDSFPINYPGCSVVLGDVKIGSSMNINNLNGLVQIEAIKGDLIFLSNPLLTSLAGLDGLKTIKGNLEIGKPNSFNPGYIEGIELISLSGLETLDSIDGTLGLHNLKISNLNGLESLKSLGSIEVSKCSNLTSFTGLFSLNKLGSIKLGEMFVCSGNCAEPYYGSSSNFLDFSGLDGVDELEDISIIGTPVASFSGLENVKKIHSISIFANHGIKDFSGLVSLEKVTGDLRLGKLFTIGYFTNSFNLFGTGIESFIGLESVDTIASLEIVGCDSLIDFHGLDSLRYIRESLAIGSFFSLNLVDSTYLLGNQKLSSFQGLSSLSQIGGNFDVFGNNQLTDFDGLSNLQSITGRIWMVSPSIEGLSGLDGLVDVGSVRLGANQIPGSLKLNDISALIGLDTIKEDLFLHNLDSLTSLLGLSNLLYVGRTLSLQGLENLSNMNELSNIGAVGKSVQIGGYYDYVAYQGGTIIGYNGYPVGNPKLGSLSGISGIKHIGEALVIGDNTTLTNINGLNPELQIDGCVYIGDRGQSGTNGWQVKYAGNPSLVDISALGALGSIQGDLYIVGNDQLVDLTGVGQLDSIHGDLTIIDNQMLENLDGVEGLQFVDGLLIGATGPWGADTSFIEPLYDISGVNDVSIGHRIVIVNNEMLSECSIKPVCQNLVNEGFIYISSNAPGCNSIQELDCSKYGISGVIFYDGNQNQVQDPNEGVIPNQKVFFSPPNQKVLSDQNGEYIQICDTGTVYSLQWVPDADWNLTTNSDSISIMFEIDNPENKNNDFGLYPNFSKHAGHVNLSSNQTRCNSVVAFFLRYSNTGTFNEQGIARLSYDLATSFVSAEPMPDVFDSINHQLIWYFDSLYPFQYQDVMISFLMPDQNSTGQPLHFLSEMLLDSMGVNVIADSYNYSSSVVCSFDPNDKQVTPVGETTGHYTLHDQKLTYTVHFQNTGNAEAIDITILDTIDIDLDLNTFRVVNSSFPVQTAIKNRAVAFYFHNIWLPDSTSNETESHGFLTYEISPLAGLDDYTEISNTAYIIFDMNEAIVTNTTTNVMVTQIPNALSEIEKPKILIRPNPAFSTIYISEKNHRPIDNVLIYNQLGQVVLSGKASQIDISHLPNGFYMVEVKVGDGVTIEKLLIEN